MSNVERNVRIINEDDDDKQKSKVVGCNDSEPIQRFVFGVDHAGKPMNIVSDSSGMITISGSFGVSGVKDVVVPKSVMDDSKPRHMPNLAPVKREDLRYGNIVKVATDWDRETAEPYIPTEWSKNQKVRKFSEDYVTTDNFNGKQVDDSEYVDVMAVPINDERLTKLGFEKKKGETWYTDTKGKFKFDILPSAFKAGSFIVCIVKQNLALLNDNIQYIHELQNVYYTFTREDLDVTTLEND